ncbi:MAG: molybdate ABC transporter permease subunit [Nitrospinota bacterium]
MEGQASISAQLSLWVAGVSTLIVAVLGTFLAYLFAKRDFLGKNVLDILITLPLVLPPTVTGYYLILLLGRRGWIGGPVYDLTGWTVTFTWWAAVIASTVVSLPFMVRAGRAAIESVDRNVEYASQLLGKREWYTALTITLPLARRGLIAGLVLSFARAMGEFGATLMLAGNIPGRTNTMPLEIYSAVAGGDMERAHWLVLAHTGISFLALYLATRWSRERVKVGT